MEYIGTKESSQGTNLGTIGNIFQVLPSTAVDPGYGLSYVDGNSASSTAAYVAALEQANGGSLSAALSQYSGGAYNGSDMASVLDGSTAGSTAGVSGTTGTTGSTSTGSTGSTSTGATGSTGSTSTGSSGIFGTLAGWLGLSSMTDVLFLVVAVMLIGAGLFALVMSNKDLPIPIPV